VNVVKAVGSRFGTPESFKIKSDCGSQSRDDNFQKSFLGTAKSLLCLDVILLGVKLVDRLCQLQVSLNDERVRRMTVYVELEVIKLPVSV
jgi:hypothetical protein